MAGRLLNLIYHLLKKEEYYRASKPGAAAIP